MTGLYSNSTTGGVTLAPVSDDGLDLGIFPTPGTPTLLTSPFDGVLKGSNAVIGRVVLENPTSTLAISNFPGLQRVEVTNLPSLQTVSVANLPAVQRVEVTNPTLGLTVNGTVAVSNFPETQKVELTGQSAVTARLTTGSAHIGSVGIDGPITGSVEVTNPVTSVSINNFPVVQPVSGTLSISNFPPSPTAIRINNDTSAPIPVAIVSGGSGGSQNFDGNVTLKAGTAHIGSVNLDAPVTLATGTSVGINGQVGVSNFPTSFAVSNLPTTQTVAGTVSVNALPNISGTVAVSNFPATQAVSGTVALASNAVTVSNPVRVDSTTPLKVEVTNQQSGGSFDGNVTVTGGTLNIGNFPATQPVSGTVAVANPVTSVSINNANSAPVPVSIQGGVSTFDGVLKAGTAHVGNVGIDGAVTVSGTVTTGNRLTKTYPYQTGTVVYDTGIIDGQPTQWRTLRVSLALTGPSVGGGQGTGTGSIKIEGSNNGTAYILLGANLTMGSGVGGGTLAESVAPYRYLRVTIDESGYSPARSGEVTIVLDERTQGELSESSTLNVILNTAEGPIGVNSGFAMPIYAADGNPQIPVRVEAGTVSATITNPVTSVTVSNLPTTQPVSIANTVNVAGSVNATITGTPTVALASNSVSVSNFPTTQPVTGTVSIGGTVNVAQTGRVSLNGLDGANAVSNTNAIPVSIVGGSAGGGTSFDGQLRQNGNAVTPANPLPTSVGSTTYAESTGTLGIAATFTGATRATPGPGLVFAVRGTNNGVGSMTVRIEGSNDGTTWTILRTSVSAPNSFAVTATDAVFPFYRGSYVNGSVAQNAPINLYTYFTPQVVDNGYYILGGVVSVTTSATAPLFVTQSQTATMSNISGSITTGGTAQSLVAANSLRKGLWIQNQSSGDLYLLELGTAVMSSPSLKLAAGAYYEYPQHGIPTTAISIIGATSGQAFAARQW